MKALDYFDRVSVISLLSRTDRRRDMTRELERHGMPIQAGKVEFFDAFRPAGAGGFPTIGLHGCYLSHLGVLRQARDAGVKRVLVLEDDAQISRQFDKDQERLVAQLDREPWGIVFFGHPIDTGAAAPGPSKLIPHVGAMDLAHFYGVNETALDRLVRFLEGCLTRPPGDPEGGPMSPDGAISVFRERNPDLATLIASPNLGWQRSSRTDNHALRWFDRTPIVRDAVAVARRARAIAGSFR